MAAFRELESLSEWLGARAPRIHIVDVGAMWFGAQSVTYKRLLRKGFFKVVGFEPGPGECQRLRDQNLTDHTFLPYFIGDGSERRFHVGRAPMTSSLYEPNMPLLKLFNQLPEVSETVHIMPARTTRLDDVPEIERMDYLKIDAQGAELDVLKGAERLLSEAVFVQCELEFVPLYKGQPLFSDVEPYLRARGFLVHSVLTSGRTFRPFAVENDPDRYIRQNLWAECLFVRDFTRLQELSEDQLLRLAVILHDHLRSVDLAALVLQHADVKAGRNPKKNGLWAAYVARAVPPGFFPGGKMPEPVQMT